MYLLNTINKTKLWDKVIVRANGGALLAGSSAGAMVMGKYILSNPMKSLFMNKPADWEAGFGIVKYTVIPHFNRVKNHKKVLHKIIEKAPDDVKNSCIGIDENTALIIDSIGSEIKGLGNVDFHV